MSGSRGAHICRKPVNKFSKCALLDGNAWLLCGRAFFLN